MKIAVLGTGVVGHTIAARLDELGHDVLLGTRDPATTRTRDAEFHEAHPGVVVATFADAAASAELVVNATNGSATLAVLDAAGSSNLDGKVLIDVSNPLDFSQGMPPTLFVKDSDSLAEQIQRAHPGARVVKSLNTLTADLMVHPAKLGRDSSVFVSGDDAQAKQVVTGLLTEFGHTDVIDLGDLTTARGAEMWLPLWLRLWGALGTPDFNLSIVR